jgi:hypothetical protein
MLGGEWIVEVHGFMRILAVLRFQFTAEHGSGRFNAGCTFGGPPGWEANGTWTVFDSGGSVRLAGIQSSPYLLTTDYLWGATLDELGADVLHGESISGEQTLWHRVAG